MSKEKLEEVFTISAEYQKISKKRKLRVLILLLKWVSLEIEKQTINKKGE